MTKESSVEINWKFLIGLIAIIGIALLGIYLGFTEKSQTCINYGNETEFKESNCLSEIVFYLPLDSKINSKGYTPNIKQVELCNMSDYYYPVYIQYANVTEIIEEHIYNFTTVKEVPKCVEYETKRVLKINQNEE